MTQSDDFDVILGLINQLSQVLEENRQATNDLLAAADSLGLDDDDTDTERSVRTLRPIVLTNFLWYVLLTFLLLLLLLFFLIVKQH